VPAVIFPYMSPACILGYMLDGYKGWGGSSWLAGWLAAGGWVGGWVVMDYPVPFYRCIPGPGCINLAAIN
jgi:hypothetical protein